MKTLIIFLGLVRLTVGIPDEDPQIKSVGVVFENRGLELLKKK